MILDVLVSAAITSLIFTVIILASYRLTPKAWLSDISEGKIKSPPEQALPVVVIVLLVLLGGSIATAWWIASVYEATFFERFVAGWVVVAIVNLTDLLIIDFLIYMWIYPSWMRFEGIEPLHRTWPHIKGAFNGLAMGLPIALLAATVTIPV